MMAIWRSQTPPKWDAWGGLKTHSQFCWTIYYANALWSISFNASSNSDFAPTKFVLRSHLNNDGGPRIEKKRLKAQIKEHESIDALYYGNVIASLAK